jgi:hypothetical protein
MIKKLTLMAVAAAALTMAGCVTPLETASGNPEVVVQKDAARVKNELLAMMSAQGFAPTGDSENTLAFSKQLDVGAGMFYQLALGNAYSSQPQWHVRFTLIPMGKSTHVYAFVNVAMQGAFGQDQGMDDTRGKAGHEVQSLLNQL